MRLQVRLYVRLHVRMVGMGFSEFEGEGRSGQGAYPRLPQRVCLPRRATSPAPRVFASFAAIRAAAAIPTRSELSDRGQLPLGRSGQSRPKPARD